MSGLVPVCRNEFPGGVLQRVDGRASFACRRRKYIYKRRRTIGENKQNVLSNNHRGKLYSVFRVRVVYCLATINN